MRKTIYKAILEMGYEKTEKWLNQMSQRGLQLVDIGFVRFVFEEGTPGEYIYRYELLPHLPSHPQSIEYIRFLEETGIEHVGSLVSEICLRKKATDGPFDIFSDLDSRLKHFKRIFWVYLFTIFVLLFAISMSVAAILIAPLSILAYLLNGLCLLCLGQCLYFLIKLTQIIKTLQREKLIRE